MNADGVVQGSDFPIEATQGYWLSSPSGGRQDAACW
jgi:hypothetical protein